MRTIQQLTGHIREEISDAHTYIEEAMHCMERDTVLADLYYRLANEELKHMEMLHNEVVREIENWRRENGDPPDDMQARYDVLHEVAIEDANKVRMMMQIYKENRS